MLQDIGTVLWKECRTLLRVQTRISRTLANMFVPLLLFGIVFPISMGEGFMDGFMPLLAAAFGSTMVALVLSPDVFAGERERHTLNTILASRLPILSILLGKTLLVVAASWAMGLITPLIGLLVSNIAYWHGEPRVFNTPILCAIIILPLLFGLLMTTLGAIVGSRAPTVQGAQQTLGMLMTVPLLVGVVIPLVMSDMGSPQFIETALETMDWGLFVAVFCLVVAVVDAGLLLWARSRWRRDKLVA